MRNPKIDLSLVKLDFEIKTFELDYEWKLSRNSSSFKRNLIITLIYNGHEFKGEAAPNVRYNEDVDTFLKKAKNFRAFLKNPQIKNSDLNAILDLISTLIINDFALQFGLSSVFESLAAHLETVSIPEFFGLPKASTVPMMYSIPIMSVEELEGFINHHHLHQYQMLKLKVNWENAIPFTLKLFELYQGKVCVDANESFQNADDVMCYLDALATNRLEFLEQPLHTSNIEEIKKLKGKSSIPIFADESFLHNPDWNFISENFDGVNIKLMKAGSITNAVKLLELAFKYKLKVLLGCMVESTIGISYAFQLASAVDYVDLDGFLIIKDEPFHLLTINNGLLINIEQGN